VRDLLGERVEAKVEDPTENTTTMRKTTIALKRPSVCPGAVMKNGRWSVAAGFSIAARSFTESTLFSSTVPPVAPASQALELEVELPRSNARPDGASPCGSGPAAARFRGPASADPNALN
jgi:hypothetical protein